MNPLATIALTSKQRKITAKVQKVMGPETQVLYSTLARAKFAMTPGSWVLGIFLIAITTQGAVPGVILLLIFRELVAVPHYLAVTPTGVAVLNRSQIGGSPRKVIERCAPNSVSLDESKGKVICGTNTYGPNRRDFNAFKGTIEDLQAGRVDLTPSRTGSLVGAR